MKAEPANLLDFLEHVPQCVIPIYQRSYAWTVHECQQFWHDILRAGKDPAIQTHFLGSVVYVRDMSLVTQMNAFVVVIDGQQRLTTVMLLLEALARRLGDECIGGVKAEFLRNRYLWTMHSDGKTACKLLLTEKDKESFLAVMSQAPLSGRISLAVKENFEFFERKTAGLSEAEIKIILSGLKKLTIIDVMLEHEKDDPQLIFESMNATGKALTQADLIRNYVFNGVRPEEQEYLYKKYWLPMEENFGYIGYAKDFNRFMRNYLSVKTESVPKIDEVFEGFRAYDRHIRRSAEDVLEDLYVFSTYFCKLALYLDEDDLDISLALVDLKELGVDAAYPFLLGVYHDYVRNMLSKEDFVSILRLVESYIFRRTICGLASNSLNKMFVGTHKTLQKYRQHQNGLSCVANVRNIFRQLQKVYFPRDEQFKQALMFSDIYNKRPKPQYVLRRLENFGRRKELISIDEYTVEHIMPQTLSSHWKTQLGSKWKHIYENWLHTLGNLTLTGYNAEYSNKTFVEKRDMDNGFKSSPLYLNEDLRGLADWTEPQIQRRAEKLASQALSVWAFPFE